MRDQNYYRAFNQLSTAANGDYVTAVFAARGDIVEIIERAIEDFIIRPSDDEYTLAMLLEGIAEDVDALGELEDLEADEAQHEYHNEVSYGRRI